MGDGHLGSDSLPPEGSTCRRRASRGLIPDAYLDALSVERRREVWSRILALRDQPGTASTDARDGVGLALASTAGEEDAQPEL